MVSISEASRAIASLVLASSLLVLVAATPHAAAGTDVPGGSITVDTAWTKAGSPYVIHGNVTVGSGVTLAIGPGVDVRFGGNYSLFGGRIYANGTLAEPVTFGPLVDTGRPWQWGSLQVTELHGCAVRAAWYVWASSPGPARGASVVDNCTIDSAPYGLSLYSLFDARIANVTIRRSRLFGLRLEGGMNNTLENILVDGSGTALSLEHIGHPDTGMDPIGNVIRHFTGSNFSEGVSVSPGWFPPAMTNLLTCSLFRDGGMTFPTVFSGHVYGNSVVNTTQDFGFPAASGTGSYDDGSRGNYWSSYRGTDANGDGIGDTPYGPDRYPLMAPVACAGAVQPTDTTPPVIAHAPPASVYVGDAITINATVTDPDSAVQEVRLVYTPVGGTEQNVSMTVSGGSYTYTTPAQSSPGIVRYRIYAVDPSGNRNVTAEYAVSVQERPSTPGFDLGLVGALVGILAALVVAVALVLWRRRKKRETPPSVPPSTPP